MSLSACSRSTSSRPWHQAQHVASRHTIINVAASASSRSLFSRFTSVFGGRTMATAQFTADKWWDHSTVAVVTGANKGIGKEIARQLASQGLTVVATSRNVELGKAALPELEQVAASSGGSVVYHQLDVSDDSSISAFKSWAEQQYGQGGITMLVNNAGFAYKGDVFGPQELRATLAINYYGTVQLTEALLPLIKPEVGRVVTVSSRAGLLGILKSQELKDRFSSATSKADVDQLVQEFVALVDKDPSGSNLTSAGWPRSMYGVSKLALTQYCRILGQSLASKGIKVAACCPGWVATDMSSHRGTKTVTEGADTPVWLALQPDLPSGKLWAEREQIAY